MTDLPQIQHGHAPLDVCHRSHSGVAHHVMPGCACGGPTQMVDVVDAQGKVVGQRPVKVPNHVMIWDNGKSRSISIDDARAAGLVV